MEKLLNEFVIHRPIDDAWAVLTDVERIAPCMPGAQLQEIEGDIYRGVVTYVRVVDGRITPTLFFVPSASVMPCETHLPSK